MDEQRVTRRTFPTASFSLEVRHISWLDDQAKVRAVAKSVIVRELLDKVMKAPEDNKPATKAA